MDEQIVTISLMISGSTVANHDDQVVIQVQLARWFRLVGFISDDFRFEYQHDFFGAGAIACQSCA